MQFGIDTIPSIDTMIAFMASIAFIASIAYFGNRMHTSSNALAYVRLSLVLLRNSVGSETRPIFWWAGPDGPIDWTDQLGRCPTDGSNALFSAVFICINK